MAWYVGPITNLFKPSVNFTASIRAGNIPLTVNFTDQSTKADFWAWDFTNDSIVDSVVRNTSTVYASSGTFSVKLTVSNGSGASASLTRTNYITVYQARAFYGIRDNSMPFIVGPDQTGIFRGASREIPIKVSYSNPATTFVGTNENPLTVIVTQTSETLLIGPVVNNIAINITNV